MKLFTSAFALTALFGVAAYASDVDGFPTNQSIGTNGDQVMEADETGIKKKLKLDDYATEQGEEDRANGTNTVEVTEFDADSERRTGQFITSTQED